MSPPVALKASLAHWVFPVGLLAYVLICEMVPAQWQVRPWLAGVTLVVVGGTMALRPTILTFAHPLGVRLAGIFILGVSVWIAVARLLEIY